MCEVLDRVEARGIKKGIEKGRKEGMKEGAINVLIPLVKDGILSISEAAKRADISVENFIRYMEDK